MPNGVALSPQGEPAMDHDAIAHAVIDGAMRVHSKLGPGLLESVYEACLVHELTKRGLLSTATNRID
jgi:GxxExxY protein